MRAGLPLIAAALFVTACGTTSAPPPPPVIVEEPPEVSLPPEPVVEEPVVEERTGLIPPHMEDRELARVALLLPFSADNAGARAESLRLLRAAELALFERAGGNLLMIPKDTQGTPEGARNAALAAVEDGADMIIGPLFGPAVAAAGDVARQAEIPVVAFSTDASIAGDGVYLLSFPPEIEVERVVEYAARQGVWKYAYLGAQNRYGQAVYNALQNSAAMTSGEVTSEAFYTGDVEAMSRAAARLAEEQFLPLTPEQADELRRLEWIPDPDLPFQAVILPEGSTRLRALGPLLISQSVDPLVVRFLGTGLWNDETLLREPALYGGWFAGPDRAARERFDTSYELAYGSEPSRISSLAYDALALAAHLDGGELGFTAEAIEVEQGFMGADGLFRFGEDGIIQRGLAVYELRSRGFRVIEPAPASFDQPLVDPALIEELEMRRELLAAEAGLDPDFDPYDTVRVRNMREQAVVISDDPRSVLDPEASMGPADQAYLAEAEEEAERIDYTLFRREMPEDYPRPGDEEEELEDGELGEDGEPLPQG